MRLVNPTFAGTLLAAVASFAVADDAGRTLYQQRCAACHLADAAGVPGAYPRLAGRADELAASEAGRRYLVLAVARGVAGVVEVDGARISGVMPPQSDLSDEQLAGLLTALAKMQDKAPVSSPFTPDEVRAVRAANAELSMSQVHLLRPRAEGAAAP